MIILLVLVLEVGSKVNTSQGRRQALHCTAQTNSTQLLLHRNTFIISFIDETILLKTPTSVQKFNFQPCSIISFLYCKFIFYAIYRNSTPSSSPDIRHTWSTSAIKLPKQKEIWTNEGELHGKKRKKIPVTELELKTTKVRRVWRHRLYVCIQFIFTADLGWCTHYISLHVYMQYCINVSFHARSFHVLCDQTVNV